MRIRFIKVYEKLGQFISLPQKSQFKLFFMKKIFPEGAGVVRKSRWSLFNDPKQLSKFSP